MEYEMIRGYKVVYDIDPKKERNLVEWYLDAGVMCTNGKQAIMKINDIRIRFKYEGTKREYIEIKQMKINNIVQ